MYVCVCVWCVGVVKNIRKLQKAQRSALGSSCVVYSC